MISFPVDLVLGRWRIPAHPVFEVLAFQVGVGLYVWRRERGLDPIPGQARAVVMVAAALGAILGSRGLAAWEHLEIFLAAPGWRTFYANKTIVGALAGGWIAVELAKLPLRLRQSTGDALVFPLIAGIFVGRIGCFLTGVHDHTVGRASGFFLAFDQGDGLPRHPTALYEMAFLLLLGTALARWRRRGGLRDGATFRLFMAGYLAFRLGVDFLKPVTPRWLGLSSIQLCCALFLAISLYTLRPFRGKP